MLFCKIIVFIARSLPIVKIVLAYLFLALLVNSAAAEPLNTEDFYQECPTLIKMADHLADACSSREKAYDRFFASELEQHGAFVQAGLPGSHFGVGCTTNSHGKLWYVGLYYTLSPQDYGRFQTAQMASVDFSGNIGVLQNGLPIEYFAIRPIETKNTYLPYFANGLKNCEHATDSTGKSKNIIQGDYYATFSSEKTLTKISICHQPSACTLSFLYKDVVGHKKITDEDNVASGGAFYSYFVLSDGTFLFYEDDLALCSNFYGPIDQRHKPKYPLFSDLREVCLAERPN